MCEGGHTTVSKIRLSQRASGVDTNGASLDERERNDRAIEAGRYIGNADPGTELQGVVTATVGDNDIATICIDYVGCCAITTNK